MTQWDGEHFAAALALLLVWLLSEGEVVAVAIAEFIVAAERKLVGEFLWGCRDEVEAGRESGELIGDEAPAGAEGDDALNSAVADRPLMVAVECLAEDHWRPRRRCAREDAISQEPSSGEELLS